ncbi:hypothetical protein FOPG_14774 [Fusarium oxysporum f. sp. conglutinans race 2 54008]|uniref:Uncharacterized protein n=1 Tax=Fusarium oxysporum f. sp. conglutinans race 2 54008 TaxID=1089457 RepID=X0HBB8_FUSOX|nr:hypothetical protein FOPG_14774 [Fusarium oxysporum f. sp. conglutinans race 2 54008]
MLSTSHPTQTWVSHTSAGMEQANWRSMGMECTTSSLFPKDPCCWLTNGTQRYPGARVDHEMPWYGFSAPEIWSSWTWKERFPSYQTLQSYFQHAATVWNLHQDIEYETKVISAIYIESERLWEVKTNRETTYKCKWLVSAVGTSSKPKFPAWKGLDKFQGEIHHSSAWPEKDPSMSGKRMAVIGAGASGVQIMQEAVKCCSSVTHFIRSPNIALPMGQRQIQEDEIYAQKPLFPHIFKACRDTPNGLPILNTGKTVLEDSEEDREALFEELWKRAGYNFAQGSYSDYLINRESNRVLYDFWCKKTRERIRDPIKREILAPLKPPYWFGTKRPSLEQGYYEACDDQKTTVTNSPITEFTQKGIVTADGKHTEFDIVAVCTGYDAITGGLRSLGVKGRNGLDLDDKWETGVLTNLGMMVNGFPNFFMLYGPQAPTSTAIGPIFSEQQCEWVLEILQRLRSEGIQVIETKKESEEEWRQTVLELAAQTLLVETDSWAMGANDPKKRRECLLYLGGMPAYFKHCRECLENWRDFEISFEARELEKSKE